MQKRCSECKRTLDIGAFNKNKRRVDGHHEYCKECRKAQYERRDKEKTLVRTAKRYAEKRSECLAQMSVYYQSQKEKKQKYGREHYAKNKALYLSNVSERKEHIKRATPIWFDEAHRFAIREAYKLASEREQTTGIPWDIDHVIPLRGKLVCGLHVMENIAVIPRKENNAKRAKYVP